jgi:hypothetical protein
MEERGWYLKFIVHYTETCLDSDGVNETSGISYQKLKADHEENAKLEALQYFETEAEKNIKDKLYKFNRCLKVKAISEPCLIYFVPLTSN